VQPIVARLKTHPARIAWAGNREEIDTDRIAGAYLAREIEHDDGGPGLR